MQEPDFTPFPPSDASNERRRLGGETLEDLASTVGEALSRPPEHSGLTPQQRNVLKMLSESKSAAQIGSELAIEESTVRTHIRALRETYGASSRWEVVLKAQERGHILDPEKDRAAMFLAGVLLSRYLSRNGETLAVATENGSESLEQRVRDAYAVVVRGTKTGGERRS